MNEKNKQEVQGPNYFRDKVEKEIYGEDRFELRVQASACFDEAMKKATTLSERMFKSAGLDRKELCRNLRRFAEMAPASFWDVVEKEVAEVGVVGMEDLYALSPLNKVMFEKLKQDKNKAQRASMVMTHKPAALVNKCFYLIEENQHESPGFLETLGILQRWAPEGWEDEDKEDEAPELLEGCAGVVGK